MPALKKPFQITAFEKKNGFLVNKSSKMPCNSNNFQHIKKNLHTFVDNLVLTITLKI